MFSNTCKEKTEELNEKLRYNYRIPSPTMTRNEKKRYKYRQKVKDKRDYEFIFK